VQDGGATISQLLTGLVERGSSNDFWFNEVRHKNLRRSFGPLGLGEFLPKGATHRVQSVQPSTSIFRTANGPFQILVVRVPQIVATGEIIRARRPFIPSRFFKIFLRCYNPVGFAPPLIPGSTALRCISLTMHALRQGHQNSGKGHQRGGHGHAGCIY